MKMEIARMEISHTKIKDNFYSLESALQIVGEVSTLVIL